LQLLWVKSGSLPLPLGVESPNQAPLKQITLSAFVSHFKAGSLGKRKTAVQLGGQQVLSPGAAASMLIVFELAFALSVVKLIERNATKAKVSRLAEKILIDFIVIEFLLLKEVQFENKALLLFRFVKYNLF
jgi:hypothetical protein